MNEHFSASGSRLLIAVSVGSTALLMGIGWVVRGSGPWSLAPLAVPGGVVLKGEGRPMVVSPSEPQRFAERLRELVGNASRGSIPS